MPVLNQKCQITLPKTLCERLLLQPGDDLAFLEHRGRTTIVKKTKGGSDGVLRQLKGNVNYSEAQSMASALVQKRAHQH